MANDSEQRIQLRLKTRSGHLFKGRVVELTPECVLADFPARGAPVLRIAEVGALELAGGELAEPVELAGRVVYRSDEDHSCRYRFQIPAGHARLPADAGRRGSFRARPPKDEVIAVTVTGAGLADPVTSALEDLSVNGASLLVTGPGEARLHALRDVDLAFTLPGIEKPFELAATVRYRILKETVVKYGVELADDTPDEVRHAVAAWIHERQLDQLRAIRDELASG